MAAEAGSSLAQRMNPDVDRRSLCAGAVVLMRHTVRNASADRYRTGPAGDPEQRAPQTFRVALIAGKTS
jgi:hypothetical protein